MKSTIQQVHNKVPRILSDFSRIWNKNHLQNSNYKRRNPSQNLAKLLETCQELTSNTPAQRHTNQVIYPRQIP
jgi:hypothetical protein